MPPLLQEAHHGETPERTNYHTSFVIQVVEVEKSTYQTQLAQGV